MSFIINHLVAIFQIFNQMSIIMKKNHEVGLTIQPYELKFIWCIKGKIICELALPPKVA
jgi:hypothetical protein